MISFEIGEEEFVVLEIFNLFGQKVATLVNEIVAPGLYNIDWNASGYPSGVYYARFQVDHLMSISKVIRAR